jgi:ER-bound oxygenase mpaB/B'/Rubber oxygenase, catalytic domain
MSVLPGQDLDVQLEDMRMRADPLADNTIATLLGPWHNLEQAAHGDNANWATLDFINAQMAQWQSNGGLDVWKQDQPGDDALTVELKAYVRAGIALPDWADKERIERAEKLFMDYGMLSCTLLFCSSLPECYVIPDLAAVLHVAGQLEAHTEYRIRATAAMIFPVMMIGGLTRSEGGGLPQVLKVRLIHAMIRNLILRGNPTEASRADQVPALEQGGITNMHRALFSHGWNIARDGVPCSQDELAYTLLTFGYVFLRSMRKLGLGLPKEDELAYLHAWNVMGHVLGMETTLMAETMEEGEALFARLQARGRADVAVITDARPALGQALMKTMEAVIPLRIIKPFPVLLTRYLCGKTTAKNIGIDHRVAWYSRMLFFVVMMITRGIDTLGRFVFPGFSICRMVTRVVGYQFTVRVLMDQTRPLKLPPALLGQVNTMTGSWHVDPKAPQWLNKLEQRLTGRARDGQ